MPTPNGEFSHWKVLAAGGAAGLAGSVVSCPSEHVRTKMQLQRRAQLAAKMGLNIQVSPAGQPLEASLWYPARLAHTQPACHVSCINKRRTGAPYGYILVATPKLAHNCPPGFPPPCRAWSPTRARWTAP